MREPRIEIGEPRIEIGEPPIDADGDRLQVTHVFLRPRKPLFHGWIVGTALGHGNRCIWRSVSVSTLWLDKMLMQTMVCVKGPTSRRSASHPAVTPCARTSWHSRRADKADPASLRLTQ